MPLKYIYFVVLFIAVITIAGTFFYGSPKADTEKLYKDAGTANITETETTPTKVSMSRSAGKSDAESQTYEDTTANDSVPEIIAETNDTEANIDPTLTERTLGDPDAPVVIKEYASLTCSHCATFHKEVFGKLKEEYIDTGKVFFIYEDFPMNSPALEAAMIARCLPEKNYFKFLSFLFKSQKSWSAEQDYRSKLAQSAKLLGLDNEAFDSCLNNGALRTKIIEKLQIAQEEYGINSTPSFLINGQPGLRGVQPIEEFRKLIDPLVP
jgi:protein-disulfide isomerase